jgi:hypothetical protein
VGRGWWGHHSWRDFENLEKWKNGKMEKWKNVITARVSHMWTVVKNCWSQAIRKMEKWKNGLP